VKPNVGTRTRSGDTLAEPLGRSIFKIRATFDGETFRNRSSRPRCFRGDAEVPRELEALKSFSGRGFLGEFEAVPLDFRTRFRGDLEGDVEPLALLVVMERLRLLRLGEVLFGQRAPESSCEPAACDLHGGVHGGGVSAQ